MTTRVVIHTNMSGDLVLIDLIGESAEGMPWTEVVVS